MFLNFIQQMDSLVVESSKLLSISSQISVDIIRKPLLKSVREQRRNDILCDVTIQCNDLQIAAHRCLLYSLSEYCRTLFTGSIPPNYINGVIIMDLSSFSTVQMFVEVIYGGPPN